MNLRQPLFILERMCIPIVVSMQNPDSGHSSISECDRR